MVETIYEAALTDLGWSSFFADQISAEEIGLEPACITHIHRARMNGHSATGPIELRAFTTAIRPRLRPHFGLHFRLPKSGRSPRRGTVQGTNSKQ